VSPSSDRVNSLNLLQVESRHIIGHGDHSDWLHRLVVFLNHLKIQDSLIGCPKVSLGALHELLLNLVLLNSDEELDLEVLCKRFLRVGPSLLTDVVGTHDLRHAVRFAGHKSLEHLNVLGEINVDTLSRLLGQFLEIRAVCFDRVLVLKGTEKASLDVIPVILLNLEDFRLSHQAWAQPQ
jgi:hypothetical protein